MVRLFLATELGSAPIAYRLYLPTDWTNDPVRRRKAGVPEQLAFPTKPETALEQLRKAVEPGVPLGIVLVHAAYGYDTAFSLGVTQSDEGRACGRLEHHPCPRYPDPTAVAANIAVPRGMNL